MWHYVNKTKGIALVTVLVFMLVLAILAWYALAEVFVETKTSQNYWSQFRLFTEACEGLRAVEVNAARQCVVPVMTSAAILQQPLSWWQSRSNCSGTLAHAKYFYVVEALGNDACASVLSENNKTAEYFRITLLAISQSGLTKMMLQSTLVTSNPALQTCEGIRHDVTHGRQSWRRLL